MQDQEGLGFDLEKDEVLVIDDDAFILKLIERILDDAYVLHKVGSAEEAIEVLRRHQVKAILCDHILPGENGLDFLITVQNRNPRIKSVLFSASLDPEMLIRAINESRIYRFVRKPFQAEDIRNAIRDAVAQYNTEMLQFQI